jgi:hypothetical protein
MVTAHETALLRWETLYVVSDTSWTCRARRSDANDLSGSVPFVGGSSEEGWWWFYRSD